MRQPRRITILISEELHAKLKEVCAANITSIAAVVNRLLTTYVQDEGMERIRIESDGPREKGVAFVGRQIAQSVDITGSSPGLTHTLYRTRGKKYVLSGRERYADCHERVNIQVFENPQAVLDALKEDVHQDSIDDLIKQAAATDSSFTDPTVDWIE